MTDPLSEVVSLLQPDLSYSKLIEAAGAWRVRRSETGRPFFIVVLDGSPCLEVQGRMPLVLRKGDFVFIPSASDFATSSTAPVPLAGTETMPVEISPNLFRLGDGQAEPDVRMLIGYCAFGSSDAALLVTLLPELVHVSGEDRLTMLVQLADQEARSNRPARAMVLARLMEVLLIEALRSTESRCSCGLLRGLGDSRITLAIRGIHQRPADPWTVAGLARQSGMSRSAFFDRFKRTVGSAPMEYLLHWRMVLAKDMLRRDQGTIVEIARSVGYGSASTFSVAFSRHVGLPPSHYAREIAASDVSARLRTAG